MKTKKIFYIYIIIISMQSVNSEAWDSTSAKFYPLQIGNRYIYHYYATWMDCNILFQDFGYKQLIITKDTVMENGKRYYKFEGSNFFDWVFQRIDSSTMNVYSFENGTDKLLDSLLAEKGDVFRGQRNPNNFGSPAFVEDTTTIFIYNQFRRSKLIINDGIPLCYYKLHEGIGLDEIIFCEGSGNKHKLKGCVINGVVYGDTTLTSIKQISNDTPENIFLSQNYPNPFNPETVISYSLMETRFVTLKVYDVRGNEVATLVNEKQNNGNYNYQFSTVNYQLASGVYFYKLEARNGQAGDFSETKRMILLK